MGRGETLSLKKCIILKKSVESNSAKKIQHKLDNMFLSIDGI